MSSVGDFYDLSTIELQNQIGGGGFGRVYKAIDKNTHKTLAVKISLKEVTESSDEMISLMREVNIMSQFSHPAIVNLLGYNPNDFKGNNFPVIISEYAPNGSLGAIIKAERNKISINGWDDTQKLICIYGVASAMEYLHSKKAIHRDLKPDNILLDEFLYPKITDFGLAKILHKEFDSLTPQSNAGLKGTSYYLAPECIEDEIYSTSTDVYAFGYIVFEIMTLETPFKNAKYIAILNKTIEGQRPKFKNSISSSFKNLIESCWSGNPSNRPPFTKIVEKLENDEGFLTSSVDRKKYRAYIDYIKHCKKSFDPTKVIIDPAKFMKKKNIKLEKIKIEEEIPEIEDDSDSISMYPISGYRSLSKSCQDLVLEAEKSAEKQFKVARNLIEGKNEFPKDSKLGISYLKKSLSQGYIDPEAYGIRVLVEGKLVPQDLRNAKQVLTKNMEKTDPKFPVLYGKIMKKEEKFKEARNYFEKAASIGNGEAQYELGKMYFKGRGVKSDEKEAMKFFSRSKDNGCSKSDNFLSHHNLNKSKTKKTLSSFKPVTVEITEKPESSSSTTKSTTTTTTTTKLTKTTSKTTMIADRKKTIKRIGDVDEDEFNHLYLLFSKNPDKAIIEAQDFIQDSDEDDKSFDSFLEHVKKSQKSNCCIASWTNHMMSARCLDCQKEENSCICIPCFLAGKHDTHHSYLLGSAGAGNCDCGDPDFWKPKGNCPNHPGPDADPDISQMTPGIRKRFITVMKAAIYGGFLSKSGDACSKSFNWAKNFIQFGDGLRRCASIAITSIDTKFFFEKLEDLDPESITALIDLMGQLTSDPLFSVKMGGKVILNYLNLKKKIQDLIFKDSYNKKEKPFYPIKKFLDFSFHFFHQRPLFTLIENEDFNWVDFIIDSIKLIFETSVKLDGNFLRMEDGHFLDEIWYFHNLIQPLMKKPSQHKNIQLFINKYSRLLQQYEKLFSFSAKNDEKRSSNAFYVSLTYLNMMIYIYQINFIFSASFEEAATENKSFDLSETFSCLVDFLQNEKELLNAESVFSIEKNVPIYPLLPLHHLFFCLLSTQKNYSSAISKECKKKGISVQKFCSMCSIYPLRFLCSIMNPKKFIHLETYSLRIIMFSFDRPDRTFNPFFGLYQSLLGTATNKSEILLNTAKTFGLSLNDSDKNENIFQLSIFIIACLTDRSILSFDKVLFKRLRVIELLTRKKPSASELESFSNDKISNPIFGDDLISYAERVRTSNGSYFRLTNESEFTPFFPLINIDNRLNLLSKNKDKLVKIPEFEDENLHGLTFKECFRSPLFISLMFMNLSSKRNLAETQTGLAMFVLSMMNGPSFDSSSYKKVKKSLTVKGENLNDLTESLSDLLENESVNFATIKIQFGSNDPISILEIVQSNQEIGYEAISKADLPIKLKLAEKDDGEILRQKKEKAKKLKENIMKEYETKRNIFNLGGTSAIYGKKIGDEDNDDEKNEDDEDDLYKTVSLRTSMSSSFTKSKLQCCVCQNDESTDAIGFPCLSFPSIFPTLIHHKIHNLKLPSSTEIESVFCLSICTHSVHYNCCKDLYEKDKFYCMIDRCERNCLLPYFPSKRGNIFEMKISSKFQQMIDKFMQKAFKINEDESDEDENDLIAIKSFAGLILTVEVRHRSRPECLDNANVPFLLRNFLMSLYFYHKNHHEKTSKPSKLNDPLISLIYDILESKKPKTEFVNFVQNYAKSLKNDYLHEFLRRAAIIEDFALKEQLFSGSTKFIDWDDIFSFDSLLDRFKIDPPSSSKKNIELPPFETIKLAERFVSLYQPPYNLDIFDTTFPRCVDLLTGKVVIYLKNLTSVKKKTDLMYIQNYMEQFYKGGLGMFLALTGPNSSDLIYSCPVADKLFNQDGFYVDQFGDIDQGFKRGAILSLSRDRLESALDKLLSGDVLLY